MLDLITGIWNRKQCLYLGARWLTSVLITVRLKASWRWAGRAATVITARLHSDEMSPFGTCNPLCVFCRQCCCESVHPACWCLLWYLCSLGLPVGQHVSFHVLSVLAAPQRCLPPGQGQLNGSVWPKRFPFWGGNGVCIIWVSDTSWSFSVFLPVSSLPLLSLSLRATFWPVVWILTAFFFHASWTKFGGWTVICQFRHAWIDTEADISALSQLQYFLRVRVQSCLLNQVLNAVFCSCSHGCQ